MQKRLRECADVYKRQTHDIASSPYQDGQGDIVQELAESCRKYEIEFGVYLSPWDMHCLLYTSGVPGGIRTHGLSLRRRTLYPAELQSLILN